MDYIKQYLFISDDIRTVKTHISKRASVCNEISADLTSFIAAYKYMMFYCIPYLLALASYLVFDINWMDYLNYAIIFFCAYDILFSKLLLRKKDRNSFYFIAFAHFILFSLSCLYSSNPLEFISFSSLCVRFFVILVALGFILAFPKFFTEFVLFKKKEDTLQYFNLLRKSKSGLRDLERKKASCIQKIINDKESMDYILNLRKGTVDFERKLVSTDRNKKFVRESFDDVISVFIKSEEKESGDENYLNILFENKFKDIKINNL